MGCVFWCDWGYCSENKQFKIPAFRKFTNIFRNSMQYNFIFGRQGGIIFIEELNFLPKSYIQSFLKNQDERKSLNILRHYKWNHSMYRRWAIQYKKKILIIIIVAPFMSCMCHLKIWVIGRKGTTMSPHMFMSPVWIL